MGPGLIHFYHREIESYFQLYEVPYSLEWTQEERMWMVKTRKTQGDALSFEEGKAGVPLFCFSPSEGKPCLWNLSRLPKRVSILEAVKLSEMVRYLRKYYLDSASVSRGVHDV